MNYNAKALAAIDPIHKIGKVTKLWGADGEVLIKIYGELSARDIIEKCKEEPLWMQIDAIATPFFMTNAKAQGVGTVVAQLDFIDTPQKASLLLGKETYLETATKQREKAGDWDDMTGYDFLDKTSGVTGKVLETIENSLNPLLLISLHPDGDERFVPLAQNLIEKIDRRRKKIVMQLAQGIFEE